MIQIISPHLDDAILSMGGTMKAIIDNGSTVKVDYIFNRSTWTNPDAAADIPPDLETVSRIRQQEEAAVNAQLKYEYRLFGLSDKVARGKNSDDTILSKELNVRLRSEIDPNNCCFVPLGLGHTDHDMIREIGIELINKKYDIVFYEDLPYAALGNDDLIRRYEQICQLGASPVFVEIDMAAKLDLCKLYKSQVSHDWLSGIRSYAYSLKENKFYERFWLPATRLQRPFNPDLRDLITFGMNS